VFEMTKMVFGIRFLAVIATAGVFSSGAFAADTTNDPAPAPKPGSNQAIMSAKMPGQFGPHLPAANLPSTYHGPAPGSYQAIMSAKMPGQFGPHLVAANASQAPVSSNSCRPGSYAAIMSAKLSPSARPGSPEIYKDCGL
jgi:hypothetical protein